MLTLGRYYCLPKFTKMKQAWVENNETQEVREYMLFAFTIAMQSRETKCLT